MDWAVRRGLRHRRRARFAKSDAGKGLTYAQAAQRDRARRQVRRPRGGGGLERDDEGVGGRRGGHGLVGVAKDNLPRTGTVPALGGLHRDRARYGDRQVRHPRLRRRRRLRHGAASAGSVPPDQERRRHGLRPAASERHIYDPQNGLPGNIGLLQSKPPSYLDVPATMQTAWSTSRTRRTRRREGRRRAGAGLRGGRAALRDLDALGGHYFNRTP